jgi:peptidoglycan/LPS O-acetylase OafA/YrhL
VGEYLFLFYGALAVIALLSTLRDTDLIWVGLFLVGGWAVSNVLDWHTPITWQPGPYAVIELLIIYVASLAYFADRRRWPLLLLGGAAIVSIISTAAFSAQYQPAPGSVYVWKLTTNLCFAAECLFATWVGIADGYRTGRFVRLPRRSGGDMAPDAARRKRP